MYLQVSKQFHAIVNDPIIWRALYADAALPRPPGPFSWQSGKFLQRTLVQSEHLDQRWTSQPTNVVSTRIQTFDSYKECRWVGGRWLIVFVELSNHLVLYDFDTGYEQTLCAWVDLLMSWQATYCEASTRGLLLYVILHTFRRSDSKVTVHVQDLSKPTYNLQPFPTETCSSFRSMTIQGTCLAPSPMTLL